MNLSVLSQSLFVAISLSYHLYLLRFSLSPPILYLGGDSFLPCYQSPVTSHHSPLTTLLASPLRHHQRHHAILYSAPQSSHCVLPWLCTCLCERGQGGVSSEVSAELAREDNTVWSFHGRVSSCSKGM